MQRGFTSVFDGTDVLGLVFANVKDVHIAPIKPQETIARFVDGDGEQMHARHTCDALLALEVKDPDFIGGVLMGALFGISMHEDVEAVVALVNTGQVIAAWCPALGAVFIIKQRPAGQYFCLVTAEVSRAYVTVEGYEIRCVTQEGWLDKDRVVFGREKGITAALLSDLALIIEVDGQQGAITTDCGKAVRLVGYDDNAPAASRGGKLGDVRSEEHTSELQSRFELVCRLL